MNLGNVSSNCNVSSIGSELIFALPIGQRPISFAELFQARSLVTQLYFDNGYITSGAYIPPQTLQGKVVTIAVLEGGLENIQVTGTKYLLSNYVRQRLAIATNAPFTSLATPATQSFN